jgi:hypothetical protein
MNRYRVYVIGGASDNLWPYWVGSANGFHDAVHKAELEGRNTLVHFDLRLEDDSLVAVLNIDAEENGMAIFRAEMPAPPPLELRRVF